MTDTEMVYVFFDPEVKGLLDEQKTDLVQLLQAQGIYVQQSFAQDPTRDDDGQHSKELVTILVASAAIIAAITPAISTILNTLTHRPIIVKNDELIVVEDSKGNIVRNKKGDPILQKRTKIQMVEPKPQNPEEYIIKLKVAGVIDISFESKKK